MTMSPSSKNNLRPLAWLAAALLLWAALFAIGAYIKLSPGAVEHDVRKPLIIMASMATFLLLWALALWFRARR
jgi:hypothetical protein